MLLLRPSLQKKFTLLVSLAIVSTSLLLSYYFLKAYERYVLMELEEEGQTLSNALAHNCEYGVLLSDKAQLTLLAKVVYEDPDVRYVTISGENNELLVDLEAEPGVIRPENVRPQDILRKQEVESGEFVTYFKTGKSRIPALDILRVIRSQRNTRHAEELGMLLQQEAPDRDKANMVVIGHVRLGISPEKALSNIRSIERDIGILTGGVAILGIILTLPIVRFAVNPIRQLVEATQKIAQGDLTQKVKAKTRDEIGDLAKSFNRMVVDLRSSRDEIDKYSRTLEERVRQRTTELDQANDRLELELAERKRAEEEIRQNLQVQSTLNRLLQISVEDIPLEKMLEQIIVELTSANLFSLDSQGSIFLAEEGSDVLVMKAQSGLDEPVRTLCARVPFGKCLCGRAASERKVVFTNSANGRHENQFVGMCAHGHCCVPILYGDRVLGVLNIYVKNGHDKNPKEEDFLVTAANTLAGIIERKRTQEALKVFTAKLEDSNKELVQFAYVASHDLQEPLRKISAFGDRLATKCRDSLDEQGRDYLDRMQSAAKRMQTLIEGLLLFSRVTTKAQPFVAVALSDVMREVLADLEIRIEQMGGRVECGELPTIDADPLQMRQLLQNLVGNALKFRRKEEAPVVTVSGRLLNSIEEGSGKRQDGLCEIIVQDNGIGFEEKYVDRIFGVFQRLHGRDEYEGTGIGLAICKKIVERHGGAIAARSALGRGSTFIATLPAKQNRGDNP
ncbi:HAMP domain-containing protein [Candidatus Poribacteria bacterium]|nr:HAMP domain-containing protein [Candidatus Poribacteria bacterium]